jgi:hypothetical protein
MSDPISRLEAATCCRNAACWDPSERGWCAGWSRRAAAPIHRARSRIMGEANNSLWRAMWSRPESYSNELLRPATPKSGLGDRRREGRFRRQIPHAESKPYLRDAAVRRRFERAFAYGRRKPDWLAGAGNAPRRTPLTVHWDYLTGRALLVGRWEPAPLARGRRCGRYPMG